MRKELSVHTTTGSLSVCRDSNRDYPDYLRCEIAADHALFVAENAPRLRTFLRRTLARLEKDAARLKVRKVSA